MYMLCGTTGCLNPADLATAYIKKNIWLTTILISNLLLEEEIQYTCIIILNISIFKLHVPQFAC